MSKKVIYVDMDGTLLDTFDWARQYAQKAVFGGAAHVNADITLHKPDDSIVNSYSMTAYLEASGATHNEAVLLRQYLFKSREYWEGIPFKEGAYDVFSWLYSKHEVYIATSVFLSESNECILGKLRFIEKEMPWFNRTNLIYSHAKYRLHGDYFLEDVWSQIEAFNGTRILFDAPYNRDAKPDLRVHSWKEIYKYFKDI